MIATKEDFENLLNDPDFKDAALESLEQLQDYDDRAVTRAVKHVDPDNPESEWITEEIENPNPLHRQKGFVEWMDIVKLNAEVQGVKVSEILSRYSKEEIEKTADVVVRT